MQQGICEVCGKVAVLHSCSLCGKRVCQDCACNGVCSLCVRGKFYEKFS